MPTVADQKLFCVEPVYRDADPCEKAAISPPTLNSRHLCVYFLLSTRKGIAVLAAVRRKSNVTDREWVTFTETQAGSVRIDVDRDFLQEMARQIFADPRIKR